MHLSNKKHGYIQIDYCVNPIFENISLIAFSTSGDNLIKTTIISEDGFGYELLKKTSLQSQLMSSKH